MKYSGLFSVAGFKRGVGLVLLSAALGGCASMQNPDADPELRVYASARPSGRVWVTTLYPDRNERVAEGVVVVTDEVGRVRDRDTLNQSGNISLRYPSNASYLDIHVTAPDGTVGQDRIERHEVFRETGNCRLPGC